MENTKTPQVTDTTFIADDDGSVLSPADAEEVRRNITSSFSNDQLMKALYYAWDAFDRCLMQWFLVGDTAEQAIKQVDLRGDGIDIGVRKMEWVSGTERIFSAWMGEPTEATDTLKTYYHEGVPIRLHIYEPDDDCIIATDNFMYRNEQFSVPNPMQRFKEVYG